MEKKIKIGLLCLIVGIAVISGWWIWKSNIQKEEISEGYCQGKVITELKITTPERPAFPEDWVHCCGSECMESLDLLEKNNNKLIKIKGKLNVNLIFDVGYDVDIFGFTLHNVPQDVFLEYKDKEVYVEGILQWEGPKYGPTVNVQKIKRVLW